MAEFEACFYLAQSLREVGMIIINEDQMIGYIYKSDHIEFGGFEDWFNVEAMTDQLYAQMMGWA